MKQRIDIILFILISCMLAACSNEDFGTDGGDMAGDELIPVHIAGNQSVSTRVSEDGNLFDINDRIGVFMKYSGQFLSSQSIAEGGDNIEFKCTLPFSRIGSHFVQQTGTVYYPVDGNQKVDFIAYYPYISGSLDNYLLPIDVTSSNKLDILYSNNMTSISKKRDTTMLTFNHMMSRVELELKDEYQQAYLTSTGARITGLKCTAVLNLVNGRIEQLDSEGDIDLDKSDSQIYRAFLIPQSVPNSKLYIKTENDGTLVYEFPPDMVFQPGKYYQYVIKIKDKTQLEVSQVTITDWNGKNEEPIEKTVTKYQVGDYYPDPDNASNAIGIVYEITDGEGYNGKMVSLDHARKLCWGDQSVNESQSGVSGITDENNGSVGTRSLIEKRKDEPGFSTTYGVFNWIYEDKNQGDINGRWYLPAINELKTFWAVWDADRTGFNKKLTDAGYNEYQIIGTIFYCSSTEESTECSYFIPMSNGSFKPGIKGSPSYSVRAVSTF